MVIVRLARRFTPVLARLVLAALLASATLAHGGLMCLPPAALESGMCLGLPRSVLGPCLTLVRAWDGA